MTRAEVAGHVARLDCHPSTIQRVPGPPGVDLWRGVNSAGEGVLVALPRLRPGAPPRVRRLLYARVVATLSGRCPRCGEVVGHGDERAELAHEPRCPVGDSGTLARWAT